MSKLKVFRVTGEIRKPKLETSFKKEVLAAKPEHAVERVYAELGSKHRVKRFHIKIVKVEDAGPDLLQIRGREPTGQPQTEHRRGPGLLQHEGRRRAADHRDRRRAVGLRAGLWRDAIRHRRTRLHGAHQLRAEALPTSHDAALRRGRISEPERQDRGRQEDPRGRP